jgi:hypothetical protein
VRRTAAIIVNISQTENKLLSFIHSLLNLDPAESENWQPIITNLRTSLYHARRSSPLPSKIRNSTVLSADWHPDNSPDQPGYH